MIISSLTLQCRDVSDHSLLMCNTDLDTNNYYMFLCVKKYVKCYNFKTTMDQRMLYKLDEVTGRDFFNKGIIMQVQVIKNAQVSNDYLHLGK